MLPAREIIPFAGLAIGYTQESVGQGGAEAGEDFGVTGEGGATYEAHFAGSVV